VIWLIRHLRVHSWHSGVRNLCVLLLAVCAGSAQANELAPIPTNRRFDVLPQASRSDPRAALRAAARELGDWKIEIAGVPIDGATLAAIVDGEDESVLRAARESLRRAVDLDDLLLFLDDLFLAARERGIRGSDVCVPSGRARSAGLLLHPQEVFGSKPRRYGQRDVLEIDRPSPPKTYPPAEDGEPLGPRWTARFPNPESEPERLAALAEARPQTELAARIQSLLEQLRGQGAQVFLTSTVRRRERGYLMWGAFILSRADGAPQVERSLDLLERRRREWGLTVPVRWQHPDGARATIEAAREMADTYEVVYATEQGARESMHYTGVAVDLVAVGLPRRLTLRAPDGAQREFDLSDPSESRDLSLSPRVIDWVEAHFGLRKLESDYPHWDDADHGTAP